MSGYSSAEPQAGSAASPCRSARSTAPTSPGWPAPTHSTSSGTFGADQALDYRSTDLDALGRFDVIVDTAGSQLLTVRRLLNRGGRMVTITIDMNHRLASLAAITGSTIHRTSRIQIFRGSPDSALLTELAQHAEQGRLLPVVDRIFPLDQIADAHRALEAGGVHGKHVIHIGSRTALTDVA